MCRSNTASPVAGRSSRTPTGNLRGQGTGIGQSSGNNSRRSSNSSTTVSETIIDHLCGGAGKGGNCRI